MPLLGQVTLWLAFMLAAWGMVVGVAGARTGRPELAESARRTTHALAAVVVVAVAALVVAIWRRDFRVAYVAAHADRALPASATLGVLLDGAAGRLLVGVAGLAVAVAIARATAAGPAPALGRATALALLPAAVVLGWLVVRWSPFAFLSYTPLDGRGLEPRLQDGLAQLETLARCLAFGVAPVPLAWLAAGRGTDGRDPAWRHAIRIWTLVGWALLSAALGLGLWLALRDGSPGGVGAALWQPALLLWLGFTALLHAGPRGGADWATHGAHAAAAVLAVSLGAAAFAARAVVQLRPGESAAVGPYAVTYVASSVYPAGSYVVTHALLELRRAGRSLGRAGTVRRQQLDLFGQPRFAPAVRPAVWPGWQASVYARWAADSLGGPADFQVAVVPLARWIWIGWWLAALAAIAALWRRRAPA